MTESITDLCARLAEQHADCYNSNGVYCLTCGYDVVWPCAMRRVLAELERLQANEAMNQPRVELWMKQVQEYASRAKQAERLRQSLAFSVGVIIATMPDDHPKKASILARINATLADALGGRRE